jgi:hypothetical protein
MMMATILVFVVADTIISFMTFVMALAFFSRLERGVLDE